MQHASLFLVTMICLALAPPAPGAPIELYSTLAFRESPWADFRGVVRLSPEAAARRNHYRFVRDRHGRLVELSFRLGAQLRAPNHTANLFFRSSMVRISYRDGLEVRRFFDRRGHPVAVAGTVFEERYELDAKGRRSALRFYDAAGEPVESGWGIASYHWRIDPDGSVVEWRKDARGHPVAIRPRFDFGVLRLHYDARGDIALMQNLSRDGGLRENGTGVAQDRLAFDRRGRFLGWNVLDARGRPRRGNGPNVARGIVTPDRWGYEAAVRFEGEAGEPIRNAYGWGGSRTVYDDFGNWRARSFYDEQGRPLKIAHLGYHRYVFEWDASGLLNLGMRYLDTEGRPVPHLERGYAEIEYRHDERGNTTAILFLDTAGRPVARTDTGVAQIERRYDSTDRLVEERCFDADGRRVRDRRRGFAVARYRYDERGVRLPAELFDALGVALRREGS